MEPVTKKMKHDPLALHDAIANVHNAMPELHADNYEIIKIFCKNKDAAKIKDMDGYYPLYLVCRHRPWFLNHPSLIAFVIDLLYCYPEAIAQDCWNDCFPNPLHVAIYRDNRQLVLMILDQNISLLNKLDSSKQTPLQIAVKKNRMKQQQPYWSFQMLILIILTIKA